MVKVNDTINDIISISLGPVKPKKKNVQILLTNESYDLYTCFCFCLPKVRLSAPKSDVAELAYSSPEIFANGGS